MIAINLRLHGYFRSSASWRVRIALALKELPFAQSSLQLPHGEQRSESYLRLNPQGLVPTLELGAGTAVLTQSLAICEYLDETHPTPALLPGDALARAHIRAFAQAIACDIHPLQNSKILKRLRQLGIAEDNVKNWARDIITEGFIACSALLVAPNNRFCFGDAPTLADLCLVPQMANARRFGVDLAAFPHLLAIEAACMALPAFSATAPERQPDAQ